MILRLDRPLHQGYERHLQVDDEQRNAGVLQVLREPGVVDVIVRRQSVLDLVERDARASEIARITAIDPGQPRSTRRRDVPALTTQ